MRCLVLLALLALCFTAFTGVHAHEVDAESELEFETSTMPAAAPQLSRPLIENVLSSPYKRDALSNVADIIKSEPAIAKLDKTQDEDEWNGEEDGEDRFAYEKKLKDELRSLTALVKQSKQIVKMLPEKEARIKVVQQKLQMLHNEYAKEDALLKYKQQRALMRKIAQQELALKDRVNSLQGTEAKLKENIQQHKKTLQAVGVREQEMKILDM